MDYLVHQLLRKSAGTHPDRLALIDRDRTITYAELDRRSDEIARALAGLGVGSLLTIVLFPTLYATLHGIREPESPTSDKP